MRPGWGLQRLTLLLATGCFVGSLLLLGAAWQVVSGAVADPRDPWTLSHLIEVYLVASGVTVTMGLGLIIAARR
jgi:hypothetical protein